MRYSPTRKGFGALLRRKGEMGKLPLRKRRGKQALLFLKKKKQKNSR
jgi:hypothetical protein